MPIKDPDRRREVGKAWRERRLKEGYGKALYRMRQLRLRNEVTLRMGLEDLLLSLQADLRGETWITDRIEEILASAPPVTGSAMDYMPEEGKKAVAAEKGALRAQKVAAGRKGGLKRHEGTENTPRVRTRFRPDGQVREWKKKGDGDE